MFSQLKLMLVRLTLFLINCANNQVLGFWQQRKSYGRDCSLLDSKNGIGAGDVRDVQVECKFDGVTKKFFNEVSWKRPVATATAVVRYKLVFRYSVTRRYCFQVDSGIEYFHFNTSVGFQRDESMYFALIPQPVVRIGRRFSVKMKQVEPCPPVIKLLPLPSKTITKGSEISFVCRFEEAPFERLAIEWYFTTDVPACILNRHLLESVDGFEITRNNRSLRIINAEDQHAGCYVVKVYSGIGDGIFEEKGYLRLNETRQILRKNLKEYTAKERDIISNLSVGVGIIVFVSFIVLLIFISKHKNQTLTPKDEPASSLCISHSLEEPNGSFV